MRASRRIRSIVHWSVIMARFKFPGYGSLRSPSSDLTSSSAQTKRSRRKFSAFEFSSLEGASQRIVPRRESTVALPDRVERTLFMVKVRKRQDTRRREFSVSKWLKKLRMSCGWFSDDEQKVPRLAQRRR